MLYKKYKELLLGGIKKGFMEAMNFETIPVMSRSYWQVN